MDKINFKSANASNRVAQILSTDPDWYSKVKDDSLGEEDSFQEPNEQVAAEALYESDSDSEVLQRYKRIREQHLQTTEERVSQLEDEEEQEPTAKLNSDDKKALYFRNSLAYNANKRRRKGIMQVDQPNESFYGGERIEFTNDDDSEKEEEDVYEIPEHDGEQELNNERLINNIFCLSEVSTQFYKKTGNAPVEFNKKVRVKINNTKSRVGKERRALEAVSINSMQKNRLMTLSINQERAKIEHNKQKKKEMEAQRRLLSTKKQEKKAILLPPVKKSKNNNLILFEKPYKKPVLKGVLSNIGSADWKKGKKKRDEMFSYNKDLEYLKGVFGKKRLEVCDFGEMPKKREFPEIQEKKYPDDLRKIRLKAPLPDFAAIRAKYIVSEPEFRSKEEQEFLEIDWRKYDNTEAEAKRVKKLLKVAKIRDFDFKDFRKMGFLQS